jgi:hypothetical protein
MILALQRDELVAAAPRDIHENMQGVAQKRALLRRAVRHGLSRFQECSTGILFFGLSETFPSNFP